MCGGGGGVDDSAAKREAERQRKINDGYEQIKKIFEGYTKGVNLVSDPAAGQFFDANGNPVTITQNTQQGVNQNLNQWLHSRPGLRQFVKNWEREPDRDQRLRNIGFDPSTQSSSSLVRSDGLDMTAPLYSGTESVGGFDEGFYNQRATDYTNFAMPQLEDQYKDAQEQLLFALARTGRLQSSTRGTKSADLQKDYDIQKTNVADKANQYAGDARSAVERSRADLVAMNNAIADPAAMAQQSALSASALRSAPAFDPMAPLFQNVTEGIATQADLERRNQARFNTGMFTPALNKGAGRNVRG